MTVDSYRKYAREIEGILENTPLELGGFMSDPYGIRSGMADDPYATFARQTNVAMRADEDATGYSVLPGSTMGGRGNRSYLSHFDQARNRIAPNQLSGLMPDSQYAPAQMWSYTPTPLERVEDFVRKSLGRTAYASQKARDIKGLLEWTPADILESAYLFGRELPNMFRNPETGLLGINGPSVREGALNFIDLVASWPDSKALNFLLADRKVRQHELYVRDRSQITPAGSHAHPTIISAAAPMPTVIQTKPKTPIDPVRLLKSPPLVTAGYPRTNVKLPTFVSPSRTSPKSILAYLPTTPQMRLASAPAFGYPATWQGQRHVMTSPFEAAFHYPPFAERIPSLADAILDHGLDPTLNKAWSIGRGTGLF